MRKLVLFCCFCFSMPALFGQYLEDKDVSIEPRKVVKRFETETWKTACTIPKGQLHLSILAPCRWGLTNSTELQTSLALWAYATPNLYLKKRWYGERWFLSTKHGFYYPSIGLKRLKNDGENSTLEPDSNIPQILTFQNELIVSYVINPSCNVEEPLWIATARVGTDISFTGEIDESFYRMTFFSLYHRTASFFGDKVLYAGLQLDTGLLKKLYLSAGCDAYSVAEDSFSAVEAQGNCIYHYNRKLSISAGAKFVFTNNPIESEWHLFPTVDICYRFGIKGILERGLFFKEKKK